jgi:carbon-monoxide dehydrogenase small subunit
LTAGAWIDQTPPNRIVQGLEAVRRLMAPGVPSCRNSDTTKGIAMPQVSLTVNGKQHTVEVEGRTLLVELLREKLGLTGTHIGCDTSQCGACVVHVDGISVKSCTQLALQADGTNVLTIEGLAEADGTLHPMQEMFREHHALQCGFCTPGMVMTAVDLVQAHPEGLTEKEIREGLEGNLCRCTGYHNIVKAIAAAHPLMHAKAAE